jgi:hypothetical protein
MALVHRNGKAYLYRSVRRGGRVTSEYVASGESAVLIAALETIDRDGRDYESWRDCKERQELTELKRALDDLAAEARGLSRAALEAAGYPGGVEPLPPLIVTLRPSWTNCTTG